MDKLLRAGIALSEDLTLELQPQDGLGVRGQTRFQSETLETERGGGGRNKG